MAKKRNNVDVRVEVDRHSGEFKTFRRWLVVEDGADFVDDDGTEFDSELHIYQAESNGVMVDSYVEEEIESLGLNLKNFSSRQTKSKSFVALSTEFLAARTISLA